MSLYPQSIRQLIKELSKLPGIGEKSAERLAMHLLRAPRKDNEALARSIAALKDSIRLCSGCFALSDDERCEICQNPSRDSHAICVVEQPADMVAIERSGAFNGRYHILQGALSPMDGVGPGDVRIAELLQRVRSGEVSEVILATGTSVEGEATAAYLAEKLAAFETVKLSRIAAGVPMGGDLKYVDQVTLKKALEARHVF